LVGRSRSRLEGTRLLLRDPERHAVVAADIRDARSLREGLAKLELEGGGISAVIANAGVGGENQYGDQDRWDEILETNLTGTYRLIQECLPGMRVGRGREEAADPGYRHIVIVSSILAQIGVPKYAAYCASKAGLLGLMRSLAAELAPERVLVNAVCPGWVDTEMSEAGIRGMALASGQSASAVLAGQMARVPLGKMSRPEEIAQVIRFLVSGAQSSVTGQTIGVNNGAWM
jgi:NAD(P)-dependent dehydrogenase (short-subunit alcohol dehydrogenase family)